MDLGRLCRHLFTTNLAVRRTFHAKALAAIEQAIRDSELTHGGEICFAVEAALPLGPLRRGETARDRAIETFSRLRVWDTEDNNGVLIYLLLADHDVEIVADRGIHRKVGAAGWEAICRDMEQAFREDRFEAGVVAGVEAIGTLLARHFPARGANPNELSDRPVIL